MERRINLLPAAAITTHFVFERDGFVALVERRLDGLGNIGTPGLMVSQCGFAALTWRGTEPWFVAKGFEQRATASEVEGIRSFARDLEYSLSGG